MVWSEGFKALAVLKDTTGNKVGFHMFEKNKIFFSSCNFSVFAYLYIRKKLGLSALKKVLGE